MKIAKKPNIKGPRYRSKVIGILTNPFIEKMKLDIPSLKDIPNNKIKDIVLKFNNNLWNKTIEYRDGVELPEQLGHIFIGTCLPAKSNVDYKTSSEHMKVIQYRNWESDSYLAKIFYTNYGTKYIFKDHELWGFIPFRNFKRTVSKEYPTRWKEYILIDKTLKVSALYRRRKSNLYRQDAEKILMQSYNEFDI